MPLIALTNSQLQMVRDIAEIIPPWQRDRYLERLAALLAGVEIGDDAAVHKAAIAARAEILTQRKTS